MYSMLIRCRLENGSQRANGLLEVSSSRISARGNAYLLLLPDLTGFPLRNVLALFNLDILQ